MVPIPLAGWGEKGFIEGKKAFAYATRLPSANPSPKSLLAETRRKGTRGII